MSAVSVLSVRCEDTAMATVGAVLRPRGREVDPRPVLRAQIGRFGEVRIVRNVLRILIRGKAVALGQVDASEFDPCPALRARIGRLGGGKRDGNERLQSAKTRHRTQRNRRLTAAIRSLR
jgi:hypothetical protein